MNNMTVVILIAIGLIVFTKGKIFSTLGASLGLGERVAGLGEKAITGVSMMIDVTEDAIEIVAVWAAEEYYYAEGLNSAIIDDFEDDGITGETMRTTIDYIEQGKLPMFEGLITEDLCSKFFMDIVEQTAGYSEWNAFNKWATIQVSVILA